MFKLVVLSVALAVASANPSGIWGGLATPWNAVATPLGVPLTGPILAGSLAPIAPIGAYNYRGPLSLAPGQPANILAADGRPLDTLSVNLDRAAHLTAKAIQGSGHLLKKRSIVGAPLVASPLAATRLVATPWAASPLATNNLAVAQLAGAGLISAPLATTNLAAAQLAGAGVISTPWAAPLTVSQSGPLAIASPIAPLGLRYGAGLGQLW
ncbi:jg25863 [Pararge aegeria aegeria]|uniref:Jg25863 protein n=1 Tax=Pararge aegeria aegeria TaxID=348720 RepID=A0A8S4RQE8_9NEOP|nr:jg25863 [Pararge aegeria aegeria]